MAKSASALASLLPSAAALRPPLRAPPRRTLISAAAAAAAPPPSPLPRVLVTAPPLTNRGRHSRRRSEQAPPFWAVRKKPSSSPPRFSSAAVTSSASTNGRPEYDRLLPCPLHSSPLRVEHLVVSERGNVLDYISRALHLPPLFVADLIHFGAVHFALVCPEPPPTATPEQFRIFKEVTEPAVLQKRPSIKGKTVREAQKTFRITDPNQFVEAGCYLRVHVHPKRFPRCYEIDWRSRIIAVTDSYVVLDKPAATSVGGTTDNIEECCATFASRALGLETPLRTTHQLDNCTEGCVVLARTKEFCSVFHGKIREKQVEKLYLALAAAPVTTGVISHYMRPVNIAPRLVSEVDSIGRWHLCQLEVLECKEVPWPNSHIRKIHNIEDCGWPSQESAYECKINLVTGKTHQEYRGVQFTEHGRKLNQWELDHPAVLDLLRQSGFYGVSRFRRVQLDQALLAALVERCRQETQTFHFRHGEMTVILQDVAIIYDLRVDGLPVTDTALHEWEDLCDALLGDVQLLVLGSWRRISTWHRLPAAIVAKNHSC